MIHVCFGLYDKTGRYSKFTGTTILSIFENTTSAVTVHILHDNTLTNDNRDKLIQVAERYNQIVKFYNVEELCADKLRDFKNFVPLVKISRLSIGAMYRLLAPQALPHYINRVIYLDSDIIVNLDINELWQIELGNKIFAAAPEAVINYLDHPFHSKTKFLIVNGYVNSEDYFNSGVLLMDLDYMRNAEEIITEGVKFCGQYPQCDTLDQDILNYLFSKNYLKLPEYFDVFVGIERRRGQYQIRKAIYHYGGGPFGAGVGLDTKDVFNRLWMDYFIKTPFFDAETIGRLYASIRQVHVELKKSIVNISAAVSGKTRTFVTLEKDIEAVVKIFSVSEAEEILIMKSGTPLQNLINVMDSSRGKQIFFILLPNFPFNLLEEAGFVHGKDFVNCFDFMSEANGLPLNPYPFLALM